MTKKAKEKILYVYICVYIYIYIYTHTHTYEMARINPNISIIRITENELNALVKFRDSQIGIF